MDPNKAAVLAVYPDAELESPSPVREDCAAWDNSECCEEKFVAGQAPVREQEGGRDGISKVADFEAWWNSQGRRFTAAEDVSVQRVIMGIAERAFYAGQTASPVAQPPGRYHTGEEMNPDKAEVFDPEKVRLHFEGCCSYSDSWVEGEPFPEGWGPESEARRNSYVTTDDYDALLSLYKAASLTPSEAGTEGEEWIEDIKKPDVPCLNPYAQFADAAQQQAQPNCQQLNSMFGAMGSAGASSQTWGSWPNKTAPIEEKKRWLRDFFSRPSSPRKKE